MSCPSHIGNRHSMLKLRQWLCRAATSAEHEQSHWLCALGTVASRRMIIAIITTDVCVCVLDVVVVVVN